MQLTILEHLVQRKLEVNQEVDREKIKRIRKIRKIKRIRRIEKIEGILMRERKAVGIEKIRAEIERIEKKRVRIRKIEKIKRKGAEAEIKKTGKKEAEAGIERTEKKGVNETDLKKPSVRGINPHLILQSLSVEDRHLKLKEVVADSPLIVPQRLERQWTQRLCFSSSRTWSCSFSYSSNRWDI